MSDKIKFVACDLAMSCCALIAGGLLFNNHFWWSILFGLLSGELQLITMKLYKRIPD